MRFVITNVLLVVVMLLFAACGGGGSSVLTDTPQTGVVDNIQSVLVEKPGNDNIGHTTSDLDYPFVDPTPDDGHSWDLIAGQTTDVGEVSVTNDGENFYVEFTVDEEGWLIHEVQVYIGCDPPESGAPGQFTFVDDDFEEGLTTYTATIPIEDACIDLADKGGAVYVATHAVVCTGGADEDPYGGYTGGMTSTMYAGQHTESGDLTVEVVGDNLEVTYETSGGWEMGICQLYVGTDVPGNAPGQYPYHYDEDGDWFTSHTFEIPLTELEEWGGDVCLYIAAHADTRLALFDEFGDPAGYQYETSWATGTSENGFTEFGQGWGGYYTVCLAWDWFEGDPTGGYCETAWGGPEGFDGNGKKKNKFWWDEFGWNKKWGGYFTASVFPITDFSSDTFTYRGFRWLSGGGQSYWDIVFEDAEPTLPVGSFMNWNGGPSTYYGNKVYHGWCVDNTHTSPNFHTMRTNHDYDVILFSTYDPNMYDPCADSHTNAVDPGLTILENGNWDFINYMINQRHNPTSGGPWDVTWNGTYRNEMEEAIWYFSNGSGVSGIAVGMVEDAIANGDNFVPGTGEWYGIALMPNPADCAHGNTIRAQFNIIEVDP